MQSINHSSCSLFFSICQEPGPPLSEEGWFLGCAYPVITRAVTAMGVNSAIRVIRSVCISSSSSCRCAFTSVGAHIRLNRWRQSHQTRSVEQRQLDEGIGDTFVLLGGSGSAATFTQQTDGAVERAMRSLRAFMNSPGRRCESGRCCFTN